MPSCPNALTVDVEDYFQVSAFENRVSRKNWEKYESRVEANTDKLLSIFDECGVQGTFFILGWVAERYPELVRRIHASGHEIASHGYWHRLVYNLTPTEFAKDIDDSRDAIANACGIEVTAYRAPSFSITEASMWSLDILVERGFRVDSEYLSDQRARSVWSLQRTKSDPRHQDGCGSDSRVSVVGVESRTVAHSDWGRLLSPVSAQPNVQGNRGRSRRGASGDVLHPSVGIRS